jgi:DNA ligase (NAD+)
VWLFVKNKERNESFTLNFLHFCCMDEAMNIKTRIEQLQKELSEHNYRYYVLAEPVISDYEFDQKLKELEALEKAHPEFASPDSPTSKVGGEINKNFETVLHKRPMLSLGNTYNEGELREFDQRVKKGLGTNRVQYVCELKIDGLAISIHYENGVLAKAITRGDGVKGDEVTDNVKTIKNLPNKLKGNFPKSFEVRGEIFMHRKAFERLNLERQESREPLYANPRNVAAGSLKLQDSREVAKRPLDILLYHILTDDRSFTGHYESLLQGAEWGLPVSNHSKKCDNMDEVLKFISDWESKRKQLTFDIDGVVIKVNDFNQQEELGFTAKIPRWAISFKYKTESALTRLLSIDYQVGRTGSITPVANLEPVLLLGTKVKRASLHNANEIERLGIHHGDWVYVEKGGEIIPKITHVELSKRLPDSKAVEYITHCPECQTALVRQEGEANHYCPNETACPPQVVGKIQHFISRKAMDIEGLGEETIELLFKNHCIQHIADLYSLRYEDLIPLERMADKSVKNILAGVEASKLIPFERVLFALGIRHVGETVAKKLTQAFADIDSLMQAGIQDLEAVEEVGYKIAESVYNYFQNPDNVRMIEQLKAAGLTLKRELKTLTTLSNELEGKSIVISGVFEQFSREQLKEMVEQHGGKNVSSISNKTSFVLAGNNMGPAKLEKAEKLGIPILSEEDFLDMIGR